MLTRYAVSIILCAVVGVFHFDGVLPAIAQPSPPRKLAIVVGRNAGVREVDSGTLRRVFRGETTELGAVRLIPFNYAAGEALRVSFDQQLLSWSPEQTGRYWVDRRVRGQGRPPHVVPSPIVMLAVVEKLAGAIGYVPAAMVNDRVQVLQVDGRAPSDPLYAFDSPQ